jgi:drug/metabolite transporter (DMT)-like permease
MPSAPDPSRVRLVILLAWLCYYSAAKWLPLAELTVLYFAAPIITTILAVPVLGESITLARWGGVLVGFVGVLIACRPGRFHATHASYLVLLAAVLWAAAAVLVRKVSIAAGSFLQMVYGNAVFVAATALGALLTWHPVSAARWGLLVTVGILGAGAQLTFFEAMRRAPASVLAPFEYTALVWAFMLGYLVWGDVPDGTVFVGAVVIILSGVIVFAFDRSTHDRKLVEA